MTKLIFIEPSGDRREIEARPGDSIMIAATAAGIDGIAAECGGSCMCATCHCLVEGDTIDGLPPMEQDERDTLEFTAAERHDNSRLTCQVRVAPELDGLVLRVVGR